jgi:hypothetical protein
MIYRGKIQDPFSKIYFIQTYSDPWLEPLGKHSKSRIVLKSLAPVVNKLTLKYRQKKRNL